MWICLLVLIQQPHTLFDMVDMQEELQHLLNRKVDLVSRRGIEMSRNYIRKKAILESAEVVYFDCPN